MSEPDLQKNQNKTLQPQNESTTKVEEPEVKPEKTTIENASDVGTGKNTKEETKGNKNNKTVDADKLKATADKVSSTFFPGRKSEELENLKQFGKEALPYLTEIGKNSRSPRVKKKVFDIMDEINQSEDKDEQGDVKEFEDAE